MDIKYLILHIEFFVYLGLFAINGMILSFIIGSGLPFTLNLLVEMLLGQIALFMLIQITKKQLTKREVELKNGGK